MKVTPAFFVSLATTAEIPIVESVSIEVGGAEKKVTAIAGGWYLGSPQATGNMTKAAVMMIGTILVRRFDRKKIIAGSSPAEK